MSPAVQAKLLRVLDDRNYRRVGGTKERHTNARIIAATNKPLEAEQKAGRFREDLYYRLSVVTIDLPPLQKRREDIPSLIEHFLTTRQYGKARCRIRSDAMQALLDYAWPGNVRELANVLERAQILAEEALITLDDLPDGMHPARTPVESGHPDSLSLDEQERRVVQQALHQAAGNKVHAAKLLGISRRALYRLVKKHDLLPVDEKADAPAEAS